MKAREAVSGACGFCSSLRLRYLFARSDEVFGKQNVYQCDDCGLVFVNPLPEAGILKNHYNKHFFTEKFDFLKSGEIWKDFYELNLAYIEKIRQKGKLLEIGCGLGHFLNAAKKRGWETVGVELSEFAAKYASDTFGLRVYHGLFENFGFADNHFDVVALWATLEHLTDPVKKLFEICRVLKPGGMLMFSVPNHNFLMTHLYGMKKTDMQYCEHIYHFPFKTLKKILNRTGFTGLRRMVIFGGSPNKSRLEDLAQFAARRLNIGSEDRLIAFKKNST